MVLHKVMFFLEKTIAHSGIVYYINQGRSITTVYSGEACICPVRAARI